MRKSNTRGSHSGSFNYFLATAYLASYIKHGLDKSLSKEQILFHSIYEKAKTNTFSSSWVSSEKQKNVKTGQFCSKKGPSLLFGYLFLINCSQGYRWQMRQPYAAGVSLFIKILWTHLHERVYYEVCSLEGLLGSHLVCSLSTVFSLSNTS